MVKVNDKVEFAFIIVLKFGGMDRDVGIDNTFRKIYFQYSTQVTLPIIWQKLEAKAKKLLRIRRLIWMKMHLD